MQKYMIKMNSENIYAEFWFRALALLVDVVLSAALSTVITLIIFLILFFTLSDELAADLASEELQAMVAKLANVFSFIITWIYFTIFESSRWQGTPGKKILGLRVIDLNGYKIGLRKANIRYWSKAISFILLVGYIMAAFTEKKQALHDMIAGTIVVKN
jgi:uncharacterized RDD family membrane protein YckC